MRAFKYLIPRGLVLFCIVTYRPFWFLSIVLVKDLLLCPFHKEPIIWEKMSLGSCQPDTQRFRCTTYCFSRGLLVNPWRNLQLQICDFLLSVCHVKRNYHDKDKSLLRRGYLVFLSGTFERAPPGNDSTWLTDQHNAHASKHKVTLQGVATNQNICVTKPDWNSSRIRLRHFGIAVSRRDLCYCYNW